MPVKQTSGSNPGVFIHNLTPLASFWDRWTGPKMTPEERQQAATMRITRGTGASADTSNRNHDAGDMEYRSGGRLWVRRYGP